MLLCTVKEFNILPVIYVKKCKKNNSFTAQTHSQKICKGTKCIIVNVLLQKCIIVHFYKVAGELEKSLES